MCLVSSPKVVQQTPATTTVADPPILRNTYLDGVNPLIRAQSTGLSSLRINRTAPSGVAPASGAPTSASPLAISRGALTTIPISPITGPINPQINLQNGL